MLYEQTQQKLIDLRLAGMSQALEEYHNQTGTDDLSFEERFGFVVDREWTQRQDRKLTRRLKTAKLRHEACMEDIDYRKSRHLDRTVMQRLATCQWIRNKENIIITGATGVGKTWISCALAHKACLEGFTSLFTRVPRFVYSLTIAHGDGTIQKELLKIAKTNLLIMDDWGLAPLSDNERRHILEVLEDRQGISSTIVNSQIPLDKWHDYIGDPTIADAIMDRIVHNAHRIELSGASLRKQNKQSQKEQE